MTASRPEEIMFYLIYRNKHRETSKMKRQRNMSQMKDQDKPPEKELNETETSNLLDKEFKTLDKGGILGRWQLAGWR